VDGESRWFRLDLEPLCNAAVEKGKCWMSGGGSQGALEVAKVSVPGWLLSQTCQEMDWSFLLCLATRITGEDGLFDL
jgi:hypothetical protein